MEKSTSRAQEQVTSSTLRIAILGKLFHSYVAFSNKAANVNMATKRLET
jgi:hypothetical protein